MNATPQPAVDSVVPILRSFPREGGPWSRGEEWFARLIGFQFLVVAFALAGSLSRALHSPIIAASTMADDVPVIDFPVEQAGDGPAASENMAEVADPVEAVAEPALPELVEVAPVESERTDSPVPELVEALPAPLEKPAAVVEQPMERPRPVANTGNNPPSRPTSRPEVRPSSSTLGGGTASAPVLFGGGGTGRFPLPPYPSEARRRGIEGNVMLRVEVSEVGRPDVPRIESSSGSSSLDRAAVDWIRARWRWEPGPVRHYRIPISYQIR